MEWGEWWHRKEWKSGKPKPTNCNNNNINNNRHNKK